MSPNLGRPLARRSFLKVGGATAAGLVLAACGGDEEPAADAAPPSEPETADVVLDFSDTVGVLNYAYALEQLEAAFYTAVNDSLYADARPVERAALDDIMAHEIAHREFFKAVLGKDAIGALKPDFSKVDFSSRTSVLRTAATFENLGVGAYNGAARYIDVKGPLGAVPLMAAGDIVSVEARHASTISDLLADTNGDAFAPDAFDEALAPKAVLAAAQPFIKTSVVVRNVPS